MSVHSRLLLTWVAVAGVLLAPGVYALQRVAELRDIASTLGVEHRNAYLALGRVQTGVAELDQLQVSYVALGTPERRQRMWQILEESRELLERLPPAGYADLAEEAGELLDAIHHATHEIQSLVESGQYEEATDMLRTVRPLNTHAAGELRRMATVMESRSATRVEEARRLSDATTRSLILAFSTALVLALGIAFHTTQALTSPLRRVGRAMADVAGGSFRPPENLPYARSDEIGDLARSFRTMTEKLAELDRLKAEFLSVATHELKTPLNVISGYADLLEKGMYGALDDRQRGVLEVVRDHTHALARQVDQLLDISRIEAGGLNIDVAPIDVWAFFAGVQRAFLAFARQKRVEFTVELDESLPDRFLGDPDRLANEVLGNVLSNAFKFTPTGGAVRVRAWARDAMIGIEVADTGIGIPPDQLPHVFDKYFQVGRQARSGGAGLGLAIAKQVVTAHGGSIMASSEPGRGTTLRVTLPVQPPTTSANARDETWTDFRRDGPPT